MGRAKSRAPTAVRSAKLRINMGRNGGTQMWCPYCKRIQVCRAVPPADVTLLTKDYQQRWCFTNHNDVHFFQRGRECKVCEHKFLTGEVDMHFLNELIELRDALSDLKQHAEKYAEESDQASKTLSKLSQSLGALQALNIYKK